MFATGVISITRSVVVKFFDVWREAEVRLGLRSVDFLYSAATRCLGWGAVLPTIFLENNELRFPPSFGMEPALLLGVAGFDDFFKPISSRKTKMKQTKILVAAVVAALGLGVQAANAGTMTPPTWAAYYNLGSGTYAALTNSGNCATSGSGCFSYNTQYGSLALGAFNSVNLGLNGYPTISLPTIQDGATFSVASSGSGTPLNLIFVESGLTAPQGNVLFNTQFGTNLRNNAQATQTYYYAADNSGLATNNSNAVTGVNGATTTMIGQVVNGVNSMNSSPTIALAPSYSLIESISITHAGGNGAGLSSDDSVTVPEPATLGLMGLALVGAGLARRARKV